MNDSYQYLPAGGGGKDFNHCLLTMNSKDVKVTIGPVTNINNLTVKRIKRKSVQLIRKPT